MNPHLPYHLSPLTLNLLGIVMLPFWAIALPVLFIALYCTWLVQGPCEWVLHKGLYRIDGGEK